MGDITCGQCGEPWGYYYITHELSEDKCEALLNGRGCPACSWGTSDRATGDHQLDRVQSISRNTDLDPARYMR